MEQKAANRRIDKMGFFVFFIASPNLNEAAESSNGGLEAKNDTQDMNDTHDTHDMRDMEGRNDVHDMQGTSDNTC